MSASLYIPSRGDRIAQVRCGVQRVGTVWYCDRLQVLVRWDEGTSSSLRLGSEELYVLEGAAPADADRRVRAASWGCPDSTVRSARTYAARVAARSS